jgi:predicted DNA-binding WGR domain protein
MKLTDIAPYNELGAPVKHVYLEFVGANDKNISGKSNKFWEAAVFEQPVGFVFVVRFGAYGKRGTIKEKPIYSRRAAKDAFKKKRSEKWDKGYTKEIDVITRLGTLTEDA